LSLSIKKIIKNYHVSVKCGLLCEIVVTMDFVLFLGLFVDFLGL